MPRELADTDLAVHIRWFIRRDMAEVLAIEIDSFDCPWTEEDFLRALRQRNTIGMVAEHNERIAGFMIYELHKQKLHLHNFAVGPRWRYRHVGAQMVDRLIGKLGSHRRDRLTLEVRETNLSAQKFFRSQGLKAIKVLRRFYEDTAEDAYLMQIRVEGEEPVPEVEPINRLEHYQQ